MVARPTTLKMLGDWAIPATVNALYMKYPALPAWSWSLWGKHWEASQTGLGGGLGELWVGEE